MWDVAVIVAVFGFAPSGALSLARLAGHCYARQLQAEISITWKCERKKRGGERKGVLPLPKEMKDTVKQSIFGDQFGLDMLNMLHLKNKKKLNKIYFIFLSLVKENVINSTAHEATILFWNLINI